MKSFLSKARLYLTLSLALIILSDCTKDHASNGQTGTDPSQGINRPMEPWVFRSVLDKKPRIITIALDKELYVAYDTQNSALYKAWKGDVELDGAVYTTYHGPQPSSLGKDYFVNEHTQPWSCYKNGSKVESSVQYSGHKFLDGEVCLMYTLNTGNNESYSIEERPTFRKTASGLPVYERTFSTSKLPADLEITLTMNYASLLSDEEGLKTNGIWQTKDVTTKGLTAELQLNNNSPTTLTAFLSEPLFENENTIIEKDVPLPIKLVNANDCRSCHNEKLKTVGPSYQAIAKRYPNTEANITKLMGKISIGGSGVWGESVMNGHPEISDDDLRTMVKYIMDLDADEEAIKASIVNKSIIEPSELIKSDVSIGRADLTPGLFTKVYPFEGSKESIFDIDFTVAPASSDILEKVDLTGNQFGALEERFALVLEGYLKIDKNQRVILRIASDDGSRLLLHGKEIINNDGLHGTQAADKQVALEAGYHPVRLEFFENGGGQSLFFQWRTANTDGFESITKGNLFHQTINNFKSGEVFTASSNIPGDGIPLVSVHPSYTLTQARPIDFEPRVGGLDFLSDGRAVVSTWDALGAVYIVDKVAKGDSSKMTVKRIASGLAEPLGLKVVNDVIYIMQKQEMTKLVDTDGDDFIDEYQVLSNNWDVTANFHEFGFGLDYKDGQFYATLATGIQPGGASALNQPKHRGSVIKVNESTGATEFVANGLRTPNGIGLGVDNEIFVADNQGDWLPASKIVHVSKDAWYGSRSVDYEGTANLTEKKPVVWLPQNEIGNSPSTPTYINDGPYKGQMLHGEVTHGGIKRVYVEKVDGEYQGCVFRFCQGLEAGINRLRWGPDGALYAGGVGSTGNWQQDRKLWYGLQRLAYNKKSTFEMLAVRAKSNGIEIEYTEALAEDSGNHPHNYEIKQWYYLPTKEYGGPKLDEKQLGILSVNVSNDRKKVFLELEGMKDNHIVYVHLINNITSSTDQKLWATEAWYTMNKIPRNKPGAIVAQDPNINTLTSSEKAAGWKLLFDGKTTSGWRNFKKETIGRSWRVINGELTLLVTKRDGGGWQAADGGDIITEDEYENYELSLEWKIAACGNSGIIYNVHEGGSFDYVWQTGPEMQILDNSCHPDAEIKTHRAGDLYDMISCSEETVLPAGNWNHAKLKVQNGQVEHWLNGKKLVTFEMYTPQWKAMIAKSKFSAMKGFGSYKKGHISLQDHGDRVAFRNVKIREL